MSISTAALAARGAVPGEPTGYKRPSTARIIEALRTARGIVSIAAHVLGVHRNTLYNWMKDDESIAAAMDDIRESNVDLAEAKALTKALDEGHPDILRFYLRCFGKNRGWVEVTRIEGANGGPVQVEAVQSRVPESLAGINPAAFDDVELAEFARLSRKPAVDLTHDELDRFKKLRAKGQAPTIEAKPVERPAQAPVQEGEGI